MNSFITGSQVYGKPKPDSDIDLVIRCDEATLKLLTAQADSIDKRSWGEHVPPSCDGTDIVSKSLRFGNLNLVICTDDKRFAAFQLGTLVLKDAKRKHKNPSRDDAVKLLTALRNLEYGDPLPEFTVIEND